MSVGSRRESDICTCVSKVSQSLVGCPLQGVPWEVPLDWILDGVGALEELFTGLLALWPLRGVHVLIQQLPEVVWHVQDLEVTGHPEKGEYVSINPKHHLCHLLESRLELAGHVAKVLGLPHHLADQLLLALKVVVVKLLVHLGKELYFEQFHVFFSSETSWSIEIHWITFITFMPSGADLCKSYSSIQIE